MSELKKRLTSKPSNEKLQTLNENTDDRKEKKSGITAQKLPVRVLSRMVVIFSLLIVAYYTSNNRKLKTFAKQSELLVGQGQIVECSKDYREEIEKYDGCFPRDCKRFVTDKVVSVREAEEMLAIAKKGLELGGSSGGASILDLHSGALSKGQYFINIFKNKEFKIAFTENDFNIYRVVKDKIKYSLAHHFGVDPNRIYLTYPTFFSQITPKKAVTIHDEYWHPHVDKETYKSFHYTTLLYLGDYDMDFNGGRFVFVDEKVNRTIEPRKGRVSMFTSGAENLHFVEKVNSGVRYAVTISFTCDQNYAIADPSMNKFEN